MMQCRLVRLLKPIRPSAFRFFRSPTIGHVSRGYASAQQLMRSPIERRHVEMPRKKSVAHDSKTIFKTLVKQREFVELILMIKSYLMSGHLEHAEALFSQVRLARLPEWWQFTNTDSLESSGLLNMFVQAYLESGRPDKAMEHIRGQAKQRNILTYALLLKHHLGAGDEVKCRQMLKEMRSAGFLMNSGVWEHLYRTKVLARPEIDMLIPLISSIDGRNEDITIDLDDVAEELQVPEQLPLTCASPATMLEEINAVKSNSHGIDFVKMSLASLKRACSEGSLSSETIDRYALQEKLERDCSDAASEQFKLHLKTFLDISGSPNLSRVKRLMCEWHPLLTDHFKDIINGATSLSEQAPSSVVDGNKILYSALLTSLQAEKISIITMQELTRISAIDSRFDGIPLARIATNIGACLEREIFAQQVFKKEFLAYVRLNPKQRNQILHNRRAFTKLMDRTKQVLDDSIEARQAGWIPSWSTALKAEVGTFVTHEAMKILKFQESGSTTPASPAFTHELVANDNKRFGVIKLHPRLYEALSTEQEFFSVDPTAMPMVVPPNPWLSYNQGGYLTQKQICVRLKEDPVHLSILQDANANGKMEQVLQGLDILGQTAWKINDRVLKIAISMWNSGINVSTHERAPPERLFEFRGPETFETRELYREYLSSRANHIQEKGKAHSTMCDTNYKLEIARQFSGVPFYLPHSVDFRGRAYPIPPHLSHIGSDLSRGLLLFAEGKPLGSRGLFWLKVQLANMFGFDKASLEERAGFTEEHLEDVLDSARDPINGRQWWLKADEPWQCLAACMELESVLASPNPETFISHFPAQQDGSCNGLQHYAALGRDVGGATKVNLSPSERPQDIYAAVANLVNAKIEEDVAKGIPIALKLQGKINRKIIKQPVMTNVYGVTPFGARAQIQERLKEFNVVGKEDYIEARKYLCDEVFRSLRTLFVKARLIQDWLTEAAEEISRAVPLDVANAFGYKPELEVKRLPGEKYRTPQIPEGGLLMDEFTQRYPQTSLSWDTPLGFRVVQPYLKTRMIHLKTVIQTLSLKTTNRLDPVDINKQVSAFPPNFIHSLDASHMFMTADACFKSGLTFASVHDCFWTHASTVDQMNDRIREQFVELYSQPVLERLREDFIRHYGRYKVPIKVPAGQVKSMDSDQQDSSLGDEEEGLKKGGGGGGKKFVARWRHIDIKPVPEQGDFDLTQVLKSQYFFS